MKKLIVIALAAVLALLCFGAASAQSATDTATTLNPIVRSIDELFQYLPRNIAVRSVSLKKTSLTISPGDVVNLTYSVTPSNATDPGLVFASSDETIATVTQTGQLTALKDGRTVITLTAANGKKASCKLTVRTIQVSSVKLKKTRVTLSPGESVLLTATVKPTNAFNKTLTWESSNPSVAEVDDRGLVTTKVQGTAVITARANNGKVARCTITSRYIQVSSVKLRKSSLTLGANAQVQLTYTISPANAYDKTLVWTTNNPAAVTVDDQGNIKGVGAGKATITARASNGKKSTCKVTVKIVAVKSVSLNRDKAYVDLTGQLQLTATHQPATVSYPQRTWSTSDETVAVVDQNGLVTPKALGTATITCSMDNGSKKASCTVIVYDNANPISITIGAAGDITLGGDPRHGTEATFASLVSGYNYDYSAFLKNVAPVFASDNLTVINLEGVLTNATKYQSSKPYCFRGKPEYVKILTSSSVEVANIDNNHALDFYTAGIDNTRDTLRAAGVAVTGRGYLYIKIINGVSVGFCGFHDSVTSITKVKQVVASLKAKCDIVVVSFHWGTEEVYKASASQIAFGHAAVDAGADLIVGHHPHVVSGIETYRGKTIAYSLGTLASCIQNPSDKDTFILQKTFTVTPAGVSDGGLKVIPVLMTTSKGVNNATPVLATGSDATRITNKIKQYSASFATPASFQ